MALGCPRCGTQNPDGNSFCQACGTPLNAPPPQPAMPARPTAASPFTQPPPVYQSPPPAAVYAPPPPAYQSPYYAPGPGMAMPQVHRTPWLVIVAVIAALVLVMAGVGTVLAVGLSHSNQQQAAANLSELSSPSPAGPPSPVPSPSPIPTGPKSVSNAGVTVPVPDGWSVQAQDNESITLVNPDSDGAISIASGPSTPPQTAQQNKDTVDAFFKQQYPDTKPCAGSKTTNGSLNGVPGLSWELCFTLTSGAQSVSAAALLFVGANPSGTVYYAMYMLTAPATNMPSFAGQCAPILKGIQWQLK